MSLIIIRYILIFQNILNIYDCFDFYQKEEFMKGRNQITCNYCHKKTNAKSQAKIIICPNILVINLDRGKEPNNDIKLNYEEFLELHNYIYNQKTKNYYELIGVISFSESLDINGDFIAFCRNSDNGKWYKFNDEIVTETNFHEVIDFGEPYTMFYNYVNVE